MSYPKWLYHPTQEARIVPDEAAHKALGPEWAESPADFAKESAVTVAIDDREPAPAHKHKKAK
jgi:hypothetical protein